MRLSEKKFISQQ
jgi:hypothetical protein